MANRAPLRFLHIALDAEGIDHTALKAQLDRAKDWLRYTPGCWIVRTSLSASKWYERIRPLISEEDNLLILEVEIEKAQGFIAQGVWDWLDRYRTRSGQ